MQQSTVPTAGIDKIIQRHLGELKQPGVISIRAGFTMKNGWPTKKQAIVVTVAPGAANPNLPGEVEGLAIDVRTSTPIEQFKLSDPIGFAHLSLRQPELRGGAFVDHVEGLPPHLALQAQQQVNAAKQQLPYTGPAGVSLASVSGTFPITCHASPDAGWAVLKEFLAGTKSTLTVGMYDFTSGHILDAVKSVMTGKGLCQLTLDNPSRNPSADQTDTQTRSALREALGAEFESTWALVQSNKALLKWIYPTAYHIKVAVRDSEVVWLSSGNWNNSNQPDIDTTGGPNDQNAQAVAKRSDRDWHVIIQNRDLARQFEAFLAHDYEVASANASASNLSMETAAGATLAAKAITSLGAETSNSPSFKKFFAPLTITDENITITPLLTPDPGVYRDAMLALINSAQTSLYIQLQYIHPSDRDGDAPFMALIKAVSDKINAGLDVRIILSQYQASNGWLEKLQEAGIDLDHVRIQHGVHNKAFVVDSKVVALGSQNWSSDGVLRNRDASVVIENATAAGYYEQIFLHDWGNLAKQQTAPSQN